MEEPDFLTEAFDGLGWLGFWAVALWCIALAGGQ